MFLLLLFTLARKILLTLVCLSISCSFLSGVDFASDVLYFVFILFAPVVNSEEKSFTFFWGGRLHSFMRLASYCPHTALFELKLVESPLSVYIWLIKPGVCISVHLPTHGRGSWHISWQGPQADALWIESLHSRIFRPWSLTKELNHCQEWVRHQVHLHVTHSIQFSPKWAWCRYRSHWSRAASQVFVGLPTWNSFPSTHLAKMCYPLTCASKSILWSLDLTWWTRHSMCVPKESTFLIIKT